MLRVALIGVSGYSRVHLEHLFTLHVNGELSLAAAVVINAQDELESCQRLRQLGCAVFPDFKSLLDAAGGLRLDLCIVPTPIHLHVPQTVALLEAGLNVFVEKPLAASVSEAQRVVDVSRVTQRQVAVGFQYLHAPEVRFLKQRLLAGDLGRVRRISVYAAWPRSHQYYRRNSWAGRLRVPEGWVLDSPLSNAMAHFFMLLLYFAGDTQGSGAQFTEMQGELYRSQNIESFDTAVLSLRTLTGCQLDFYGTHSSRGTVRPVLQIEGDAGHAEWVQDRHVMIENASGRVERPAQSEAVVRETMLRDVLARLRGEDRFICSPELALEHVRCVNALHEHVRIAQIAPRWKVLRQEDEEIFTFVDDMDLVMADAFSRRVGLRAAGAPWAIEPTVVRSATPGVERVFDPH